MNVDAILGAFAMRRVDAILIGGMNFLLRHEPVLTYDVDLWVQDEPDNLARVSMALADLGAEWGRDEASWEPTPAGADWLQAQSLFCLTSREGAIDIFREVRGLEGRYAECRARARSMQTAAGVSFLSLSDEDMLACQMALSETERKPGRVDFLRKLGKDRS